MKECFIKLDLTELLQSTNKNELLKNLKKIAKHSVCYHQLSQRTFHSPDGFIKWNEFIAQVSLQLISTENIPIMEQNFVTLNSGILIKEITENHAATFPCYWLDKNLLKAFENTDLPDVMGMNRSHKCGTIFLPSGEVRSPSGKSIKWLIFRHRLKNELVQIASNISTTATEDILQIFTMTDETAYLAACSLSRTDENKMPYRERNLREFSKEEDEFINKLLSISLQCLLWLQIHKPKQSIPAGIGFSKPPIPNSPSPLNPRWIGKDYQPKIIRSEENNCKTNRKHHGRKSPASHERRGHWRSQRIGKNRSHFKTIWVEPCIVGLKDE